MSPLVITPSPRRVWSILTQEVPQSQILSVLTSERPLPVRISEARTLVRIRVRRLQPASNLASPNVIRCVVPNRLIRKDMEAADALDHHRRELR